MLIVQIRFGDLDAFLARISYPRIFLPRLPVIIRFQQQKKPMPPATRDPNKNAKPRGFIFEHFCGTLP
jgi:hypothetical protein